MTKRELAAFILKLLGVFTIIQSLPWLAYISMMIGSLGRDSSSAWTYFCMSIPFLMALAITFILLTRSHRLASALIKEDGPSGLTTSLSPQEIQALGFSVVAVLVFLLAIPRLTQFCLTLWQVMSIVEFQNAKLSLIKSAWQSGLSVVIQFALSILLFFRARGLANFWHRIQIAKYEKIKNPD